MEVGVIGTTFLETGKGIGGLHAVHTHFAEAQSIYFEVRMHSTYSTRLYCFLNCFLYILHLLILLLVVYFVMPFYFSSFMHALNNS